MFRELLEDISYALFIIYRKVLFNLSRLFFFFGVSFKAENICLHAPKIKLYPVILSFLSITIISIPSLAIISMKFFINAITNSVCQNSKFQFLFYCCSFLVIVVVAVVVAFVAGAQKTSTYF